MSTVPTVIRIGWYVPGQQQGSATIVGWTDDPAACVASWAADEGVGVTGWEVIGTVPAEGRLTID